MKQTLKNILTAFAITALVGNFAFAEDKNPSAADTQSHDQHHPEGQAKEKPKDSGMMGGGMMGKMDMSKMMGMMHECMSMHKDGKMCDHEAMQKCQENMKKSECQKMMKQAKAKEKVEETKK